MPVYPNQAKGADFSWLDSTLLTHFPALARQKFGSTYRSSRIAVRAPAIDPLLSLPSAVHEKMLCFDLFLFNVEVQIKKNTIIMFKCFFTPSIKLSAFKIQQKKFIYKCSLTNATISLTISNLILTVGRNSSPTLRSILHVRKLCRKFMQKY